MGRLVPRQHPLPPYLRLQHSRHEGVADRHGRREYDDIHGMPEPHALIGGLRRPVDECDAEINRERAGQGGAAGEGALGIRSTCATPANASLNRQVVRARYEDRNGGVPIRCGGKGRYVEREVPEGSDSSSIVRNGDTVDPNFGSVVYAVEADDHRVCGPRGQDELAAVPPRVVEGARVDLVKI